jgi:hypothetical protein
MNVNLPDRELTIQYLLQEIDGLDFENKYITSEANIEFIFGIENELIENYIIDRLSPDRRMKFEGIFLDSQEMRDEIKLRRIAIASLQQRLQKNSSIIATFKRIFSLPRPGRLQRFGDWFWKTALTSGAGLVWSILAAFALFMGVLSLSIQAPPIIKGLPYLLQSTITLFLGFEVLFGTQPKLYKDPSTGLDRPSVAITQIWGHWKPWPLLWFTWAILYGTLAISKIASWDDQYYKLLSHLLLNLNTGCLYATYFFLAKKTVEIEKSEGSEYVSGIKHVPWLLGTIIFAVSLTLAEFTVISLIENRNWNDISTVFGLLTGFLGLIAMGKLLSRFESGFIPPSVWTYLLWIYIAIQALAEFFVQHSSETKLNDAIFELPVYREVFHIIILSIALIGKLCLFGFIQWLATSENLHYFLKAEADLIETRDIEIQKYVNNLTSDKEISRKELLSEIQTNGGRRKN